jgi:hypothetical protein
MRYDPAMAIPLPQRVPENAPGDFYVEAGRCLRCCLPHGEAPDLLNDPEKPFEECFFRRRPQTPEEIDRAIGALWMSETGALRYGGTDPEIVAKLCSRGSGHLCDHTPEGRAWRTPRPQAQPKERRNFFRGWFVVSLAFGCAGLAVIPSTTEPGWGPALSLWTLAAIALIIHVVMGSRLRKR